MRGLKIAALSAALLVSQQAQASVARFVLTGGSGDTAYSATFEVDDSPAPVTAFDDGFTIEGVTGEFSPAPTGGVADINFYTLAGGGGLQIYNPFDGGPDEGTDVFSGFGPLLFKGPTNAPTFLKGDYTLTSLDGETYSLSVAVPEPATWAMMIGGFGLLGASARVRRAKLATA